MTERGQAVIDAAIADGSWSQLDDIDALVVPADLEDAFVAAPEARSAYEALSEYDKAVGSYEHTLSLGQYQDRIPKRLAKLYYKSNRKFCLCLD